jgi:hypothetical protein
MRPLAHKEGEKRYAQCFHVGERQGRQS